MVEGGHVMEVDRGRELIENPKSLAGIKLSGCKNVPEAVYVDDHHVYCPPWGVTLTCEQEVPPDVKAVGLRAINIQRADGPGEGVFRMRVDRVSDSRFERMCLLSFIERDERAEPLVSATDQEVHFLHQRMFWRVSMREPGVVMPEPGDELLIHIPAEHLYVVSR